MRAFARDLVSATNQDEVGAVHAGVFRPPFWAPGYFAAAWAVWPRPFRPVVEVPPPLARYQRVL